MRYTVERALQLLAPFNGEGGSCWDADSNLERLNQVRNLIYESGEFIGTTEFGCIDIDCSKNCIYLPPHLASVTQAWVEGNPVPTKGSGYTALENFGMPECGMHCSDDGRRSLRITGSRTPVMGSPFKTYGLRVIHDIEDEGTMLKIVYHRSDGQTAHIEVDLSDESRDQREVFEADVKKVTAVIKPETTGSVGLIAVDLANGKQKSLATYQGVDINPVYTEMALVNKESATRLLILAKKTYRPLANEDLLDIESINALRWGYLAMNAQLRGDAQVYAQNIALMVDSLTKHDLQIQSPAATGEMAPHSVTGPTGTNHVSPGFGRFQLGDRTLHGHGPSSNVVQPANCSTTTGCCDPLTLDTNLQEILTLNSPLSAKDLGSDRLWFWDESASKMRPLTLGTNLSITNTTLNATGGGGAETDPIFSASPAAGIAAGDITNWNTAFGWGDHSLAGYLTGFSTIDADYGAETVTSAWTMGDLTLSGPLKGGGQDLQNLGVAYFTGQANAEVDVAGKGQIWADSNPENSPHWTGQDGVDRLMLQNRVVETAVSVNPASLETTYLVDASAGPITITLPDTAAANTEHLIRVYAVDATNPITVTTVSGTDSIGVGTTSTTIKQATKALTLQSHFSTTSWDIIQDSRALGNFDTGSTYETLADQISLSVGRGIVNGGVVSDGGLGTVDVTGGQAQLREGASDTEKKVMFDFSGTTGLALTDNSTNYIYLDRNGGTPTIAATTSPAAVAGDSERVVLGFVYREGTDLYITNFQMPSQEASNKIAQRLFFTRGLERQNGLVISETGTRNLAMTAGILWLATDQYSISAFDTSVADNWTYYYQDGLGGWTAVAAQTQINNTQYDDGTGVLATLSNNRYGVHFVYIDVEDNVRVVYGQGDYTLTEAENASTPSALPPFLQPYHSYLVAKVIIQKSAGTFTDIQIPFVTTFQAGVASSHTDLSNLAWTTSGHTGTADRFFGTNGSGAAAEFAVATANDINTYSGTDNPITPARLASSAYGFQWKWSFDTDVTDSAPGQNEWKCNNANPSLATFLYFDDDNSGMDLGGFFDNFLPGDQVLIKGNNQACIYELSGVPVDGTGYWKFPVTVLTSNNFSSVTGATRQTIVFNTVGGSRTTDSIDIHLPSLATGELAIAYKFKCDGDITSVEMMSEVSGNCVLDLWVDSVYRPTVADTITAAAKPTLSSQSNSTDSTLTGWTTAFSEGDYLVVNVDSFSTLTGVTCRLNFNKT